MRGYDVYSLIDLTRRELMKLFRLDQLHQEWEEKQDDWRCDAQHREAERQKSTRRRNTAIEFQDHHLKQVINNIGGHELDC